jgi:hypothetical protein
MAGFVVVVSGTGSFGSEPGVGKGSGVVMRLSFRLGSGSFGQHVCPHGAGRRAIAALAAESQIAFGGDDQRVSAGK